MIRLGKVTLICIDCYNYGGAVSALKKSMAECEFASVKFLTDIPIKVDGVEVVQIPSITSKEQYSDFCVKKLIEYFDTEFVMLIQHDGYVINGNAWLDEFMEYDFVAPPWLYIDGKNVGCGGVSLRSKMLQTALAVDDFIIASDPEDQAIGRLYRDYLIKTYGVKYAPEDLADKFGYELRTPVYDTFCFHGNFHRRYHPTVVIKRTAALGDVVQVEPVLQYFHDKGYRVVLDTLPQFHLLFLNHYFKVHKLQEVDQRVLATARHINLDGSYEAEPELNHLEAYFKYCGIENPGEYLKRPTLSLGFPLTKESKLFPKMAVIHYDRRGQNSRNIFGIDWDEIAANLIEKGYTVLQIGKGEHYTIKGASQINITNENFLCYVVGSADLFIGADSGPSNIAVAFGVPSIIFFGGVDSNIIHYDLSNVTVIDNGVCCELPKCWHKAGPGATAGRECVVDEAKPPCTQFDTKKVIDAINKICNHVV
jgi:hypothetical protein